MYDILSWSVGRDDWPHYCTDTSVQTHVDVFWAVGICALPLLTWQVCIMFHGVIGGDFSFDDGLGAAFCFMMLLYREQFDG